MTGGDLDALEASVRAAAFRFLSEQTTLHPDGVLPREVLAAGFTFQGGRVPLVGPQGIFKPAVIPRMPHNITMVPVEAGRSRSGVIAAPALRRRVDAAPAALAD